MSVPRRGSRGPRGRIPSLASPRTNPSAPLPAGRRHQGPRGRPEALRQEERQQVLPGLRPCPPPTLSLEAKPGEAGLRAAGRHGAGGSGQVARRWEMGRRWRRKATGEERRGKPRQGDGREGIKEVRDGGGETRRREAGRLGSLRPQLSLGFQDKPKWKSTGLLWAGVLGAFRRPAQHHPLKTCHSAGLSQIKDLLAPVSSVWVTVIVMGCLYAAASPQYKPGWCPVPSLAVQWRKLQGEEQSDLKM